MTDIRSSGLTNEYEVEQLLRDSATANLFGTPPENLVSRAMAATARPCPDHQPVRQALRPTALMVLSLAAAGLFLTALPGTTRWRNMRTLEASTAVTNLRPSAENLAVQSIGPSGQAAGTPTESQTKPTVAAASPIWTPHRHHILEVRKAPQAMWTTTVVSQSEQGIILPVVCDDIKDSQDSNDPIDSNGEDSPNSLQATGVAVVPLRSSGLTYTEYTGPNAQ